MDLSMASRAILDADALILTAGAGMGVDSGLPDFRGDEGFWKAYPPMKKLGLSFIEMANPRWFHDDAALAWGFYGHRMMLYRRTVPHAGFTVLLELARKKRLGAFVMTSNVDGQFQRAGFPDDAICEVHGSIHHLQCLRGCGQPLWHAARVDVMVDETSFRAQEPLPACPSCGGLARPNVLMFGDGDWDDSRTSAQEQRLHTWLQSVVQAAARVVVIECGAGTSIPTVRRFSESSARMTGGVLVRINPREHQVPAGAIGIPMGALDGIRALTSKA